MNIYKRYILILTANIFFVISTMVSFAGDINNQPSMLSPQLSMNITNVEDFFIRLAAGSTPAYVEDVPAKQILRDYQQRLTQDFFIEVFKEWVESEKNLIGIGPAFFAFGSARFKPGNYWYEEAKKFGKALAEHQFSVITGGGPGIMLGANEGAYGVNGGNSVGLCVELPHETEGYHAISKNVVNIFSWFFTRKLMFILKSWGGVTFPGGFGTLDEIFEVAAFNIRYPNIARPNILIDERFYGGLIKFLNKVHSMGLMPHHSDLLLEFASSAEEAFRSLLLNSSEKKSMDIDFHVFIHELFRASRSLNRVGPAVSIIGGKETEQGSFYWLMAQELAKTLSESEVNVIRRGNKGIAGAVGKAHNALADKRPYSRGIFVAMHEEGNNLNGNSSDLSLNFEYYFALKIALMEYSKLGMVVFPGGVDTLDALNEMLCLIKTDKVPEVPIILVGSDFWAEYIEWIKNEMIPAGTVNEDCLEKIYVVDTVQEIQEIIRNNVIAMKRDIENNTGIFAENHDPDQKNGNGFDERRNNIAAAKVSRLAEKFILYAENKAFIASAI